jgi:protein-S-isoprenylcysteine O-methyltransferase Ste14
MITAVQVSPLAPQLFPSSTAALIFSVVFFLWILSEIVGAWIVPGLRRGRARTRRRDRGSILFIYVGVIVSFGIAFSFAGADIAKLPGWVCYPGIILMAAGIVVRQWSIAVLGRFFSGVVEVQKDQTLVEKGPYRYVRHPSYTGALIFFVGLGLALQSWGAVLALALIFAVVYGYRMHVEEQILISDLGEVYISYSRRTKRLIPYVI